MAKMMTTRRMILNDSLSTLTKSMEGAYVNLFDSYRSNNYSQSQHLTSVVGLVMRGSKDSMKHF